MLGLGLYEKTFRAYYKLIGAPDYYNKLPPAILFCNWIFQRILRINAKVPVSVNFTSHVSGFSRVKLGKNVGVALAVSRGCKMTVVSDTTLEIGDNTIWAFNVCFQTGDHGLINRDEYTKGSIKIGKNCWIANSVTILKGIELGDNVTVGANSVVTKSFPDNVVIAGCPAKIIKYIDPEKDRDTDKTSQAVLL